MIASPSASVQQQQAAAATAAAPAANHPIAQVHSDGADSDSDWDDDDDFVAKKINIKIKPIAQLTPGKISASTDELRATVGTWKSMANINLVKPNSRRSLHQSTLQLHNKGPFDTGGDDQAPILQPPPPRSATSIIRESNGFMAPPLLPPTRMPPPRSQPPLPLDVSSASSTSSSSSFKPLEPMVANHFGANNMAPLIAPPAALLQVQAKQPCLLVAFAAQECLHVHTLMGSESELSTHLIGHIKMAVPRDIIELNPSHFENNDLLIRVVTSKKWSSVKTDENYIRSIQDDEQSSNESYFFKVMSLDMNAAYMYARQHYQKQPDSRYFLLPELATYTIRSPDTRDEADLAQGDPFKGQARQDISPLQAVAHWLCDLDVTKVRVDMQFLEDSLELANRIKPNDIRNIKLSMQVNGNVVSQQSKPEATWSPIDSRLSWSFESFQELIEMSTANGVTSCLAKLTLVDGPSTPSATSLQFSIDGKTISGVQLSLVENANGLAYKMARQKQEVRTGSFKCEPPCL